MVLEKSALFQRFQSSKNKSLVLLISTCLLLTAPASHSFFAIIFGGDIAVKIGLSIPALFGFMYSKRPGDRERDYNIMYFDAPTISYPSDFNEDARRRTECVLSVISWVPRQDAAKLSNIKGKEFVIKRMPASLKERCRNCLGATDTDDHVIWVNYESGSSPSDTALTVTHEIWHHVLRGKGHYKPVPNPGIADAYPEKTPEFWDTPFGKDYKWQFQRVFKVTHPNYRVALNKKEPSIDPYARCFGSLWPEVDPASLNRNEYIN